MRLLAVHHPRYAEPIDEHTKSRGPLALAVEVS